MDNKRTPNPRPEVTRRGNSAFLVKLFASLNAAVKKRESAGVFGELTVKITQQDGVIIHAKVLEESILKPEDI
jgi:hypothetical protein